MLSLKLFSLLCFILFYLEIAPIVGSDSVKCPDKCVCSKLPVSLKDKVDCTRLVLTKIPSGESLPPETYDMDLSMNKIQRIDVMETNTWLEWFNLASNEINSISPKAFVAVENLVSLDLSHNELEQLDENTFYGLTDLQHLNLSYNKLKFLPDELFSNNKELQELHLSHNPLHSLQAQLLDHLKGLRVLDLSKIEAYTLHEGMFYMCQELVELDLSENDFNKVPTDAIRSARKLQILKLNGNPIKRLSENSFRRLSTLNELYLDNMKELTDIREKTFTNLFNLRKLSISNNPHLTYIDKNAFYGMQNKSWITLKDLNLRANRLTELAENSLPWYNISVLDLRENPWKCDCHVRWIKNYQFRQELSIGIICASPEKWRGIELSLIDQDQLTVCNHEDIYREVRMMRLFVIVFASFVLFFMGLMFTLFLKRDQVIRWWSDRRRGTGAIYYVKAQTNPMEQDA